MLWALCLWMFGPGSNLNLEVVRTFEPIPDDEDTFLQRPGDVALDDQGRLHVMDLLGKTVLVWGKDGKYATQYGKPGEGPGEFQIMGNSGGPQGYVDAVGDTIYVYDGGARRLNLFNMDLSFRKATNLKVEGGRVEAFWPLGEERYLIFNSSYFSDTPFQRAALYKGETVEKVLTKVKDQSWHYVTSGGNRRVEIYAFAPQLRMAVNQKDGLLVLGHSEKPQFDVFDYQGKLLKTVKAKMTQQEVTQDLIDEYEEQPFIKNNNFFTAAYPEKRSFYERILSLEGDRYLAYLISPFYNNVEGYLIDGSGKMLGRFTYACGEGGQLFASRGKLFAATTNEDGDYILQEMRIGSTKGEHPGG